MKWKWARRRSPTGPDQVALLRQELRGNWAIEGLDEEEVWKQKLLRGVFTPTAAPPSRFRDAARRGWAHASGLLRFLSTKESIYRMWNLAGRWDCDQKIARELKRAQIDIVRLEKPVGDVPALLCGRIGPIELARAPMHYVAEGPVPLDVARHLYADPIGRRDALIHGMADRPAPEVPWVAWYTSLGERVYPREQATAYSDAQSRWPEAFVDAPPVVFNDSPEQLGAMGFVDHYYLVSSEGLQVFASTLRRFSVDQRSLPWWWERHRRMTARANPFSAEADTQETEAL